MGSFRVESERDATGSLVPRRVGRAGCVQRIVEVLDRWPGANYIYFRVRTETGDVLILRREEGEEAARGWELVFFERAGAGPGEA